MVYVSLVTLAGRDKRSRHVNAKPRGSPDREREESGASRFSRMLRARAQQLVFNLVNIAIFLNPTVYLIEYLHVAAEN